MGKNGVMERRPVARLSCLLGIKRFVFGAAGVRGKGGEGILLESA
jgi:hypothetical protein